MSAIAERRMFAKSIVLSDAFLDMPLGARCLYMTMSMIADDDGFVNTPKSIIRQCGASEDDLKVLISKRFIIPFDSGIIVIKHWRINNYLRSDRYKATTYTDEKAKLRIKDNGAYTLTENAVGIPSIGIPSIGKDSIDKDRERGFTPPTPQEVKAYCEEKGYPIDAERFCDFYQSKGWVVGKTKMKDWKAAVRSWASREGVKPDKEKQAAIAKAEEERKRREEQLEREAEERIKGMEPEESVESAMNKILSRMRG